MKKKPDETAQVQILTNAHINEEFLKLEQSTP